MSQHVDPLTPQNPISPNDGPDTSAEYSFWNQPPAQQPTLSNVERILDLICGVVGADWGGLGRLSVDGEMLEHTTYRATGESIDAMQQSRWLSPFLHAIARQDGAAKVVDPTLGPSIEPSPDLEPPGSILAMAYATAGRSKGIAYFVRSSNQPAFGAIQERTLQSFQTWLEQESLAQESHLLTKVRVLTQVAQVVSNELGLPQMIARSVRELERYFPLHLHSVWLVDSSRTRDSLELVRSDLQVTSPDSVANCALVLADSKSSFDSRTVKLGLPAGLRLKVQETPFGPCLNGEPAYFADLRQQTPASLLCGQLRERGASFFFAVPLRAGKQTVGVLQVVSTCADGFTSEHVQIIYLVANLLGSAISNCQLVSRLRSAYTQLRVTQDKLVQTEKMRALGELAAGVAHNFNNALCSVLGFLELAMVDPLMPERCQQYLETSRVSALDAAQIVQRIQTFARPKQETLNFEYLDFNDLVSDAVELTRPKWESSQHPQQRTIELELQTDAKMAVQGTPTELREVLTNLIFNAVDAMPRGGNMTIQTWSTPTDVFVSIRDTGTGMSDFVQHRLFEPLFTTKGEHGTGLGLSISFAIIRRHGGDITVQSALGQGSTFTVRLPVAAATSARREVEAAAASPGTAQGVRILVIEDEARIRAFLETALTALGYRPSFAVDGEAGLALFAAEPFAIVLTDVGLPGISGEEVARVIAQRAPRTPVVLLTGWADQIAGRYSSGDGLTRVLGKPVKLGTLAATLADMVAGTTAC